MILTQRCSFICFKPFISCPITLSMSFSALSSCRRKQYLRNAQHQSNTSNINSLQISNVLEANFNSHTMESECNKFMQWVCIWAAFVCITVTFAAWSYMFMWASVWLKQVWQRQSTGLISNSNVSCTLSLPQCCGVLVCGHRNPAVQNALHKHMACKSHTPVTFLTQKRKEKERKSTKNKQWQYCCEGQSYYKAKSNLKANTI